MENFGILTDPVFVDRCSPVSFAGPKRFTQPPCSPKDLPTVHLCLISHSHYDHLCIESIKAVEASHRPLYAVGLGLGEFFVDCLGIEAARVVELDWWEKQNLNDEQNATTVQFLPTQHWSKRVLDDDLKTLWGAFVVRTPSHSFFFNGDTGYNKELYEEIGRRIGPIDMAAIPIGSVFSRSFHRRCSCFPNLMALPAYLQAPTSHEISCKGSTLTPRRPCSSTATSQVVSQSESIIRLLF
jgi:N-acyl-phosphatidylethanolamine-hydrolysing phospholipase D